MKFNVKLTSTLYALILMVSCGSTLELSQGLNMYGNPLLRRGCHNCGCGSTNLGLGIGSRMGLGKIPSLTFRCPSPCFLGVGKQCLAKKLLLLKKKLLEKKMNSFGCGCGSSCCCGII